MSVLGMLPVIWAIAATDSVRTLTFDELHRRVLGNHPVVRQARLLERMAEGREQTARGAFDPTVSVSWDRKDFGGRQYFDYLDAALRIPTPFGVDVKVGFERATGEYAAPDVRTGATGLVTAGLSLPLGQGWITDERRTALARARAMREFATADREAMVNQLLGATARTYGSWYEAWQRRELASRAVALAEFRLEGIRRRFAAGDAAAVDTTEAALEVQRRIVLRGEADLALQNASLAIEALLWNEAGQPMELPVDATPTLDVAAPDSIDDRTLATWIAEATSRHPDTRRVSARVDAAGADRRLAAQRLLPDASLRLSNLAPGDDATSFDGASDRKIGGSTTIPLLFRRERGALATSDAGLDQAMLERALVRRGIAISVTTASNTLAALSNLASVQGLAVRQATELRDAEQRRFEAGESTLFLVNARDRAVIDEELKRISLEARRVVTTAELAVALGRAARLPDIPAR